MLALAFLALAQPPELTAADEANLCQGLRGYAESRRARLPEMVDDHTRVDRLVVDCEARAVSFYKTFVGDPATLAPGWQAQMQTTWNGIICASDNFRAMIRAGWRFEDRHGGAGVPEIVLQARCD